VAARFVGGVVDVPANATLVLAQQDDGAGGQRFSFHTEARVD
jgi:pyrimidine operon attenuation protein / uracil phosphoribosyltransferase